MNNLLIKIYNSIISNENDSIELGAQYDAQVEAMLEPLKERMTENDIEEIRELIYGVIHMSEQGGFMLGVRFMAGFMLETMKKDI